VEVQCHALLTSAVEGGEWSASRTGRFTSEERVPGIHWIESWVVPRTGLVAVEKRKIPSHCQESNTRTPIVQAVASHYTDWATPALNEKHVNTISYSRSDICSVISTQNCNKFVTADTLHALKRSYNSGKVRSKGHFCTDACVGPQEMFYAAKHGPRVAPMPQASCANHRGSQEKKKKKKKSQPFVNIVRNRITWRSCNNLHFQSQFPCR
jgi:hypothetical protein